MKIKICAASSWNFDKYVIIEVNSIDEAIKRIQDDKSLILSIIGMNSWLYDKNYKNCIIPNKFIIDIIKTKEYDVEIKLYDSYIE